MKKIIKIAEAREIAKSNPQLDADDLIWGIEYLNKGNEARAGLTIEEMLVVALYLISREVKNDRQSDFTCNARELCRRVDDMLLAPVGYTLSVVRGETTKCNRILIAELNMGLNHITLTKTNPYLKTA